MLDRNSPEKDSPISMKAQSHYEFLQISPHADSDTVHRVYKYLAARLHPDNPESGNAEMFQELKTAYDVLSNPGRRAEYDAACKAAGAQQAPPLLFD